MTEETNGQLAAKDSTIENLGAVIQAKEAEVTRLQAETAPAIADSYKRVKDYAEELAVDSNRLAAQLKATEAERQKIDADMSSQRLFGYADGFGAAYAILGKRLSELSKTPHPGGITIRELWGTLVLTIQDTTRRSNELIEAVRSATGKSF
jgi:hypothetical protein